MIEINNAIIGAMSLLVGILTAVLTAYVVVTNKQTDHQTRIDMLEKQVNTVFKKLDEHEDKIGEMLNEIKDSVHRVELSIANLRNEH